MKALSRVDKGKNVNSARRLEAALARALPAFLEARAYDSRESDGRSPFGFQAQSKIEATLEKH